MTRLARDSMAIREWLGVKLLWICCTT